MSKFHVSENGINICKATKRACPLGAPAHFDDMEKAVGYFVEHYDLQVIAGVLKKDVAQKEQAPAPRETSEEAVLRKYPYLTKPYVIDPANSKVIAGPETASPTGGYMGGSLFVGGKRAAAAKNTPSGYIVQSEIAKLIRADVKAAQKLGELPPDLKITVRKQAGAWVTGLDIVVGFSDGGKQVPPPDDFIERAPDIDRAIAGGKYDAGDNRQLSAIEKGQYRDPSGAKVETDQATQVKKYLQALGDQWGTTDHNGMVDYHNSSGRATVEWKSKWN